MNWPSFLLIRSDVRIPFSEITFTVARSSGPGGQNVNKVNTKVVLRWDPNTSEIQDTLGGSALRQRLSSRLTRSGELVISSDRYRSQERNKVDCVEKFTTLLHLLLTPQKIRKNSKPSTGQKKVRLQTKRKRADIKQQRRKFSSDSE